MKKRAMKDENEMRLLPGHTRLSTFQTVTLLLLPLVVLSFDGSASVLAFHSSGNGVSSVISPVLTSTTRTCVRTTRTAFESTTTDFRSSAVSRYQCSRRLVSGQQHGCSTRRLGFESRGIRVASMLSARGGAEDNKGEKLSMGRRLVNLLTLKTLRNRISPPTSPPLVKIFQTRKAKALVADGADLLDSKGAKAFQEMSKQESKWYKGNTYLFVYDLECNVLFNAASPEKVGKNTKGHPDKDGKLFHDALVAQADTPYMCGWVNYMWPKPGQDKPSQKWTYSKAVTIDGTPAVLMSGFY